MNYNDGHDQDVSQHAVRIPRLGDLETEPGPPRLSTLFIRQARLHAAVIALSIDLDQRRRAFSVQSAERAQHRE
jgi:hypothetical protein